MDSCYRNPADWVEALAPNRVAIDTTARIVTGRAVHHVPHAVLDLPGGPEFLVALVEPTWMS